MEKYVFLDTTERSKKNLIDIDFGHDNIFMMTF